MAAPQQLCPRCGKVPLSPGEGICHACQAELLAGGTSETMQIELAPVLREALATAVPEEDFDEALLRALKRLHPAQAAALFPAFSRLLEAESKATGEDKRRVAQRLADSQRRPDLTLTSHLGRPTVIHETRVTTSGGKTYHSLEELPPELRRAVEAKLSRREKPQVKMGCSMALLAGCLLCLFRALWR